MLGFDLKKPVSSKPLGLFRILFGIIMIFQLINISKRFPLFSDPEYLYFPYPELDWVPVFSSTVLWLIFSIAVIATLLFSLGVLYRYSAIVMTLAYGYFFSLDAVYYNNHYYLIFLLGLLMSCTAADASYSVIASKKKSYIPNWNYIILQLQVAIVFFYGGIVKLSSDWIDGRIISDLTESDLLNRILNYGGLVFDLVIPFLLLSKKYRWYAIIAVLLFNISNHFLFDNIASFPFLMIAAMLLFLSEGNLPSRIKNWASRNEELANDIKGSTQFAFIAFFVFQLLYPLRHHCIASHVDWTGQGHYFSWRMKSYQKDITATFYAIDRSNNKRLYPINHGLENYQAQRTFAMPHMILRIARHLKNKIDILDGKNPNVGISVEYMVSLNGRKPQIAIDPNVDISIAKYYKYAINEWIIPFKNYK